MKIGIIIPVYNEEKNIKKVIDNAKKKTKNIIIVIDGSTDRSLEIVKKQGVSLIVNRKNKGLVESLKKGFGYALRNGYDLIVKIDGDNQMDLSYFNSLIESYNRTKGELIAATYNPHNTPWMVKKDVWIYSGLFNLATGQRAGDIISEYRLFSRKAMKLYIKSKIQDNASNLSIIPLSKDCKISYVRGGVNYHMSHLRPFHLKGLWDLRIHFISEIWKLRTLKSKIVAVISIPVLFGLMVFNLTIGHKYNSFLLKRRLRR